MQVLTTAIWAICLQERACEYEDHMIPVMEPDCNFSLFFFFLTSFCARVEGVVVILWDPF